MAPVLEGGQGWGLPMHRSADVIRAKDRIRVYLVKEDGENVEGFLFAGGQERILDVMNREEPFVPFELNDGEILILNKKEIASVKPFDKERMNGAGGQAMPTYLGMQ
jgi:hypothetical protein